MELKLLIQYYSLNFNKKLKYKPNNAVVYYVNYVNYLEILTKTRERKYLPQDPIQVCKCIVNFVLQIFYLV